MFEALLCRLRLRHSTSAFAYGDPAGEGVWQEKNNSADV
jgi:hypothetical protein